MTASKVSSAYITNKRASPPVLNPLPAEGAGTFAMVQGNMEVATTSIDEVGDIILLFELKGNDRLLSLKLGVDDLDTHATATLAFDVGIYKDVSADGTAATVVDADAYASAVLHDTVLATGTIPYVEVAFEARNIAANTDTVAVDGDALAAELALGEHSLPRFIGLTVTAVAATAAAGTVAWQALIQRG